MQRLVWLDYTVMYVGTRRSAARKPSLDVAPTTFAGFFSSGNCEPVALTFELDLDY